MQATIFSRSLSSAHATTTHGLKLVNKLPETNWSSKLRCGSKGCRHLDYVHRQSFSDWMKQYQCIAQQSQVGGPVGHTKRRTWVPLCGWVRQRKGFQMDCLTFVWNVLHNLTLYQARVLWKVDRLFQVLRIQVSHFIDTRKDSQFILQMHSHVYLTKSPSVNVSETYDHWGAIFLVFRLWLSCVAQS